ncbi:MAG: hypothetical protein ACK41T_02300 [Pseudobdellovibrio sp.]
MIAKNKINIFVLYPFLMILTTSCASTNFKEKTYRNMLVAAVVGAAIGQIEKENRTGYSVAYGASAATLAAIASIEYYDADKEKRELEAKIKFMNDMELSRGRNITNDLPEDLKNLVETHHYDVYRINRWTQRGPKLLVKESEAIELKEVKSNEE